MKKISSTFMMFIMISGLLSSIVMPIYLMISTSSLKNILPEWFYFIIINVDIYLYVIRIVCF